MGDTYYGYAWDPTSVRVAEHDTYVPEGRTHLLRTTDFNDAEKVAHIRVLWPMIQGLDPVRIGNLAQHWRKLSTQLTTARNNLGRNGTRLQPQWTGEASRAFLERVGAALYSLDQWIEAAATNAATIDRLADDVRATQPKVQRIYNDWLAESATEKTKRDADAKDITLTQDGNDFFGFLSKYDIVRDGGALYRWARESVPQDEIDQKYTALALPLVKNLADHFASAAATGLDLPGRFKGPTTVKLVQPAFGGAPPGSPPARPTAPAIPGAVPPSSPGVRPPGVPTPPVAAAPAPLAPVVPGVPPGAPGVRSPATPAIPGPRTRPVSVSRPLLPSPAVPTTPALPTLGGRRGGAPGVPGIPGRRQPDPGRRGTVPGVPALPGRTGAPNTRRTVPSSQTPLPAQGVRSGLDGRTGRTGRPSPASARTERPGTPTQLAGRTGPPPARRMPVTTEPPEFRRTPPPAPTGDVEPPAKPSLGGRRGPERPVGAGPSQSSRGTRPELTGRVGQHGVPEPDTRPAVDARRSAEAPPDEAFAPAASAPAVIERPDVPVAAQPGPALGRAAVEPRPRAAGSACT